MAKGLLFVISGPSGVGKGTISRQLLKEVPSIKYSVSATTRAPREGEKDGVNYFFLSIDDFQRMIKEDAFLEYANVYGNYYGTPREFVEKELKAGNHVLLEIDIQGALQVRKKAPDAVFVFIVPPSIEELQARIMGRGSETPESLRTRLRSAVQEMEFVSQYDYVVLNDEVSQAVCKIKCIITAEECRVR